MKALRFVCQDGGTLCARCAIVEETSFGPSDCPDDEQWALVGAQLEDEDSDGLACDNCGYSLFRFPYLDGDVAWDFSRDMQGRIENGG